MEEFSKNSKDSKIYLVKREILQLNKVCLNKNKLNKSNSIKIKYCIINVKNKTWKFKEITLK